jgi:hypothetical protein
MKAPAKAWLTGRKMMGGLATGVSVGGRACRDVVDWRSVTTSPEVPICQGHRALQQPARGS